MEMLIGIIIVLLIVGVALWAVNSFVPMEERMNRILNAVVIICVVIWLLIKLLEYLPANLKA